MVQKHYQNELKSETFINEIENITDYLVSNNIQVLPLKNYEKHPNIKGWNKKTFLTKEIPSDATGIAVKTGLSTKLGKLVCIDIDEYSKIIAENVVELIKSILDIENISYSELTTSGGYHLFFFVDTDNEIKSKNFQIDEPKTKKAVKVEILGEGRIAVIAPSFAKSKNLSDEEGIGKYTNLTGKRLIDADKLSEEQFTKLVETFDKMHTKQSTSISHVIKHKKASRLNKKDKFVLFDYEFDKFLHEHKLG